MFCRLEGALKAAQNARQATEAEKARVEQTLREAEEARLKMEIELEKEKVCIAVHLLQPIIDKMCVKLGIITFFSNRGNGRVWKRRA